MSAAPEVPLRFQCGDDFLIGILHQPVSPRPRGVVVVVGGPQYRVGSHRQFVLLARELAGAGFPVLRFDYRGMGDSDGEPVSFEEANADIRAAVDTLLSRVPGLQDVVLWALCDGAAAVSFYAASDPRVTGVVIINPWVRTEAGLARARVQHYYAQRLASGEFWKNLLSARTNVTASLREFVSALGAFARRRPDEAGEEQDTEARTDGRAQAVGSLPERVGAAVLRFQGRVLLILSGKDLTALEFEHTVLRSKAMTRWRRRPNVTLMRLPDANHTYSTRAWREQVHRWTLDWLRER